MKKLICLVVAAAVLLGGCSLKREEKEPVPELLEPVGVKVDTAAVRRGDLRSIVVQGGSVVANTEELAFEIDGEIAQIRVYPGKWVEKGDVLLTLDQTELGEQIEDLKAQIEYDEANGAYDDALAELDIELIEEDIGRLRAAEEPDAQAIALREADAEQARLDLRQAQELRALSLKDEKARLEELEKNYGRNEIVAPFSGNVFYEENLLTGTWVQADKAVAYIADPTDLKLVIDAYVNESSFTRSTVYALINGNRYDVEYVPMTREEMNALVLAGRTLTTTCLLTGPEELLPEVQAGMYASLCIETEIAVDTLLLPIGAVYSNAGSSYVYVQDEKGARVRRDVHVGRSNGINMQILEGLEEGEIVYVKE